MTFRKLLVSFLILTVPSSSYSSEGIKTIECRLNNSYPFFYRLNYNDNTAILTFSKDVVFPAKIRFPSEDTTVQHIDYNTWVLSADIPNERRSIVTLNLADMVIRNDVVENNRIDKTFHGTCKQLN